MAGQGESEAGVDANRDVLPGEAGFDRIATRYDRWYERPVNRFIDKLEERSLKTLLPAGEAGALLLDVGVGTGHSIALAKEAGYRVVGLDKSDGMLRIAALKDDLDAFLIRGDAHRLPFSDARFDAILSVTALEFLRQPRLALDEMARCLKPGGMMVIGVLNALSYLGLQRKILRKPTFRDAHFYRVGELRRMLAHIGEVRIDTCAFMPPWEWLLPAGERLEHIGRVLAPGFGQFIVAAVRKPVGDMESRIGEVT
jgi:ubiquinone/menaquinone biosynthesis C-methylase UbiE